MRRQGSGDVSIAGFDNLHSPIKRANGNWPTDKGARCEADSSGGNHNVFKPL